MDAELQAMLEARREFIAAHPNETPEELAERNYTDAVTTTTVTLAELAQLIATMSDAELLNALQTETRKGGIALLTDEATKRGLI